MAYPLGHECPRMVVAPATVAGNRARHREMGVFDAASAVLFVPAPDDADSTLLLPLIAVHRLRPAGGERRRSGDQARSGLHAPEPRLGCLGSGRPGRAGRWLPWLLRCTCLDWSDLFTDRSSGYAGSAEGVKEGGGHYHRACDAQIRFRRGHSSTQSIFCARQGNYGSKTNKRVASTSPHKLVP